MGLVQRIFEFRMQHRINVASKLPFEAIRGVGQLKYQDALVSGGYHDYWDNYSRKEVTLNDPIGERITLGCLKNLLHKMPKFVENDEVQSEYIMEDLRAAINTLELKPKMIMSGVNIIVNGWTLIKWKPLTISKNRRNINGEMQEIKRIVGLSCKIFGFEECHPRYWRRFNQPQLVNKISHYRATYVPRPGGMEALYHTLTEERFILRPSDPNFQHLARVDFNYGIGYARIQPVWDAMTKLRERSDSDHFLNSNYMDIRYPKAWTKSGKGKAYVEKARKASRRRGLATEAVQNPHTNEDTGLPSVQYRPWGQGPQGQSMDKNKASAYLDGEWLRLLVNLGYSQDWATGTSAGQQEGSELNLTRDDRADIAEFAILEPIYKKMFKKLAQLGVLKAVGVSDETIKIIMSGQYVMQCWLTWEYNDKARLQQEQLDHEMEMQKGKEDEKNLYGDKSNKSKENVRVKMKCPKCGDIANLDPIRWLQLNMDPDKAICKKCGTTLKWINEGIENDISTEDLDRQRWDAAQATNRISNNLNLIVNRLVIHALRNNENLPVTPVSSTWISDVAVEDNTLYIKVPGWDKGPWMPFRYDSPQKAGEKGRDMIGAGSKGGWVWDNIWAEHVKPFSKGERDLRPGVSGGDSAEFPFMFDEVDEVQGFGTFEERQKALLDPGPGLRGTDYTRRPLEFTTPPGEEEIEPFDIYGSEFTPGLEFNVTDLPEAPKIPMNITSLQIPEQTTAQGPDYTGGYTYDPASITGTKRSGPGAKRKRGKSKSRTSIIPYNTTSLYNEKFKTILNSQKALSRFALNMTSKNNPQGWSMRPLTTYKIKELFYALANHATRQNRVSFGNSIKGGHPYNYGGEDEFICARDYKKNIGKVVPLGIYHNLDKTGEISLPEYQIIGTHEVLGWDEENNKEIAKNDYDEDKINEFFKKRNEHNWIFEDYLSKGLEPPISGAYTCNVKKINDTNYQLNIDLVSMSFVPDGNCPWDLCNFKTEEVKK